MNKAAREFIPRAPRYVFRPEDGIFLRFAPRDEKDSFTTRIINLSTSGAAFSIAKEYAPKIGTVVKVELPLPGDTERVAWFAQVVRLETPRSWGKPTQQGEFEEVIVGVQFRELPAGHRSRIRKSLEKRFTEVIKERYTSLWLRYFYLFIHYFWRITLTVLAFVGTVLFLWWFSRPTDSYDKERGAPWGQRYEFNKLGE